MGDDNGKSDDLNFRLNIKKAAEGQDNEAMWLVFANALIELKTDISAVKGDTSKMKVSLFGDEETQQDGFVKEMRDFKISMRPVVKFYRKVMTITTFLSVTIAAALGYFGSWIRDHFFK